MMLLVLQQALMQPQQLEAMQHPQVVLQQHTGLPLVPQPTNSLRRCSSRSHNSRRRMEAHTTPSSSSRQRRGVTPQQPPRSSSRRMVLQRLQEDTVQLQARTALLLVRLQERTGRPQALLLPRTAQLQAQVLLPAATGQQQEPPQVTSSRRQLLPSQHTARHHTPTQMRVSVRTARHSLLHQRRRSTGQGSRRTARLRTGSSSSRRRLQRRTAGSSRRHLCIRSTGLQQLARTALLPAAPLRAVTGLRTVTLRAPMRRQVTRVRGMPVLVLLLLAQGQALEATAARQLPGGMVRLALQGLVLLPGVMVQQQGSTVQVEDPALQGLGQAMEQALQEPEQGVWEGMRGRMGAGLLLLLVERAELERLLLVLLGGLRILQRGSTELCLRLVLLQALLDGSVPRGMQLGRPLQQQLWQWVQA